MQECSQLHYKHTKGTATAVLAVSCVRWCAIFSLRLLPCRRLVGQPVRTGSQRQGRHCIPQCMSAWARPRSSHSIPAGYSGANAAQHKVHVKTHVNTMRAAAGCIKSKIKWTFSHQAYTQCNRSRQQSMETVSCVGCSCTASRQAN
jgi:hypothetical protein